MMIRNPKSAAIAALTTLVLAVPATAFDVPKENELRVQEFQKEDLKISLGFLSDTDLAAAGKASVVGPLEQLNVLPGNAFIDPRSGRYATLITTTAMVPGAGNSLDWNSFAVSGEPTVAEEQTAAANAFKQWLSANSSALRLNMDELTPIRSTAYVHSEVIHLNAQRIVNGVPVKDAMLQGVINNGNLVLFGLTKWGDVTISSEPNVDRATAEQRIASFLGNAKAPKWHSASLNYVPTAVGADPMTVSIGQGYSHRLAWVLTSKSFDRGEWEALVDAHTGEVISFKDHATYLDEGGIHAHEGHNHADEGGIHAKAGGPTARTVVGDVFPVSNDGVGPDGVLVSSPMPFLNLTTGPGASLQTNSGGDTLSCISSSLSTDLTGPYTVVQDNCGTVNESSSTNPFDLGGAAGTDCTIPAGASSGNTNASRSGFYEINRLMEIGRSYLPNNTFLQSPLNIEMNISQTCNATSGAGGLRFYRSGGGCANTGEIAGVFDHEWGHSQDREDATPGVAGPTGEGIADLFAALRLNTSCIGRNFLSSPCTGFGDPCTTCTGVRDIDFAQHQSGQPKGVVPFGQSCGGSVHCLGTLVGESVWDLWKRELVGQGGLSDGTAQLITTHLTFFGSGGVSNWFTLTGSANGDGCGAGSGYLNYIAADDDDGDLTNGTPNMQHIFNAFNRHQIACNAPAVATSGCANTPTVAPVVNAVPQDRGIRLNWSPVANATEYQVFRTEGVLACDMGKKLVATTSDTTYLDLELNNDVEYYYTVVAKAAGAVCIGPVSSCVTATPAAGANLGFDPTSTTFTINTGDGDVSFDSCEQATVCVDLDNIGTNSLTNVRFTEVTSPSHPLINDGISFNNPIANNIAANCNSAPACFDLTAAGISPGETLVLEIGVTSDEMGGIVKKATVTYANLEHDYQASSNPLYSFEAGLQGWTLERGTFGRSDALGGGSGTAFALASSSNLDNQCDAIVSPSFLIESDTSMSAWTNFAIETGDWDRANFAIRTVDGRRLVVDPDSGRLYNINPSANPQFDACTARENGFGAVQSSWAASNWSATAMDSSSLAGTVAQIEVRYGTDSAENDRGFSFDHLGLNNVMLEVPDAQLNCSAVVQIFADGFETADTSAWDHSVP